MRKGGSEEGRKEGRKEKEGRKRKEQRKEGREGKGEGGKERRQRRKGKGKLLYWFCMNQNLEDCPNPAHFHPGHQPWPYKHTHATRGSWRLEQMLHRVVMQIISTKYSLTTALSSVTWILSARVTHWKLLTVFKQSREGSTPLPIHSWGNMLGRPNVLLLLWFFLSSLTVLCLGEFFVAFLTLFQEVWSFQISFAFPTPLS